MATSFIDTFETASISLWSILLQVAVTMSHSGLKSEKEVQFRQGKRYSLPKRLKLIFEYFFQMEWRGSGKGLDGERSEEEISKDVGC